MVVHVLLVIKLSSYPFSMLPFLLSIFFTLETSLQYSLDIFGFLASSFLLFRCSVITSFPGGLRFDESDLLTSFYHTLKLLGEPLSCLSSLPFFKTFHCCNRDCSLVSTHFLCISEFKKGLIYINKVYFLLQFHIELDSPF